jgi:regulator of sigma E protease
MNFIIVIFSLGVLVALHELGHFWMARALGMKVIKYSIGFFKPVFHWTSKKTGITYQIGSVPLGGFVQIKGMDPFEDGAFEDSDSYQMKSPWKRSLVIVAGPFANLLIAWGILFALLTLSGLPSTVDKSEIGQVIKDRPAFAAGLKAKDKIIAINSQQLNTWSDLADTLHQNPGREVMLLVERDARRFSVNITPEDVNGVGLIGIYPPSENISLTPLKAAMFATTKVKMVLTDSLTGLFGLITGTSRNVKAVGPPGIVKMAKTQLETGATSFLTFMSYISLMLFLFNLLPIPALDGGRSVFLLYEIVSRRRVNKQVDATVNTIFFFLMMAFILFISIKEMFLE